MNAAPLHIADQVALTEQLPDRKPGDRFLAWLAWALLGYALLNRSFAHIGVSPLFVGEATLAFGLYALACSGSLHRFAGTGIGKLLLAFAAWQALCTFPHLAQYGVATIRDAVLWGYAVFALVVACLIMQYPDRLRWLLIRYRRFVPIFIALIGLVYVASTVLGPRLPTIPGSTVPIVDAKAGDIMVHLAGAGAFMLVGMRRPTVPTVLVLLMTLSMVMVSNRGGMISFSLALSVALLLKPREPRVGRFVYWGILAITVLALWNPKVQLHTSREVSIEQVFNNVKSIFDQTEANEGGLEGTKEWRLNWWSDIVGYTFGGKYFLFGKGYGINLATDDGYQVTDDETLRSPHNGHMSFLARSGVPGFLLWIVLQLTWAGTLVRNLVDARRREDRAWSGIFVFLLAYWVAFVVNSSFDVFLEGPMGGIWFWCLFGTGIGAAYVYRNHPEVVWA